MDLPSNTLFRYAAFIVKWLEHFPIEQFLFLRLEDYDENPQEYMEKVFRFLELPEPSEEEWHHILRDGRANNNRYYYDPMMIETEKLLRDFYQPFNDILVQLLNDERFRWNEMYLSTERHDPTKAMLLRPKSHPKHRPLDRGRFPKHAEELGVAADAEEEKQEFERAHRNPDDLHGAVPRDHLDPIRSRESEENRMGKARLRGRGDGSGSIDLNPRAFDISDLPFPYDDPQPQFNGWIRNVVFRGQPIETNEQGAHFLCVSSFALDVAAIKYLLYDVGVPVNLPTVQDARRTALHCLAVVELLGDANGKSYIFPMLKNKTNWLTPILDPPLPRKSHIPMASDIVASLENPALKIAQWLFRAGADPNIQDVAKNTPLHFAAYGGMWKLVRIMLEHGAEVNIQNREGRTPMHNALAMGHVKVATMLMEAGAELDVVDSFGVSCRDMIVNPGPIPQFEAKLYFNLTQRDVRKIDRIVNPELHPEDPRGWKYGTGGWGPERLDWIGDEMRCDMDQYWANEITGEDVFHKYLARSAPVLIRGLIDDWPLINEMTVEALLQNHGDTKVKKPADERKFIINDVYHRSQ